MDYKIIISKKDEKISIDMYYQEEHTTTLAKDGYTYFIMHNNEEYYEYEGEDIQEMLVNQLEEIENKTYIKGKENINGKTYYYEEFEGISSFLMSTSINLSDENLKTRFYYDGNTLAYIKNIIDEETEELLETKISYSVDDSAFEIPSNYAVK